MYFRASIYTTYIYIYIYLIKEYLGLSSFELAFVPCESGALSTEPPPAGILTSCCAQYLCRPDSAFAFTTLLPSVERQCPYCLLVTTFLFSRIGSNSSDASVILKMCAFPDSNSRLSIASQARYH